MRLRTAICSTSFLAALWIASSLHAATFAYDLFTLTPDVLPDTGVWTYGGASTRSVSDPSNILTLDDNSSGTAGPYFTKSLTSGQISLTSEYESRSRMRLTSGSGSFVYLQEVYDGTRYFGWAVTRNGANTRFFIANLLGGVLTGTSAVDLAGTDFFQVDMKKTGTTGTSADTIVLSVDGTPIVSTTYDQLPAFSFRGLGWGDESTPSTGQTQLTGISFGINEAAPLLLSQVPEPASLALTAIAAGALMLRRRAIR